MLSIGKIVKAQGIKGEVKVLPATSDLRRFLSLGEVVVSGVPITVLSAKVRDGCAYIMFQGITDRNAAETLVGLELFIKREDAPKLPDGRYFVADLIGSRVYADGEYLGELSEINQYGAADVYVVKNGGRTVSFPFLKDLVLSVDTAGKEIRLKKQRLFEVMVEG